MRKKNKVIFFSPHLDDAIFSSGGTIINHLKKGDEVLVVTIFSGIPDISNLSEFSLNIICPGWATERIKENLNILNSIEVKILNLDFLDAIFRKNDSGQYLCLSWSDVFSENKNKYKEEIFLYNSVKKKILDIVKNTDDVLYFPLSLGDHVDHVLINKIAKELNEANYDLNICYYEDLPYANYSMDTCKLSEVYLVEKIEEIDVNQKISLVSKYKKSLAVGDDALITISHIKNHATKIGKNGKYFERFWSYKKN
jgi:LmbE family N-acetylglucosaminyl deacetylase